MKRSYRVCSMTDAERAEKFKAACAEMRVALVDHGICSCHFIVVTGHAPDCKLGMALSTDAGKGWVSPEEAKALRDKVDDQANHIVNMALQLDQARAEEAAAVEWASNARCFNWYCTTDPLVCKCGRLKVLDGTAAKAMLDELATLRSAVEASKDLAERFAVKDAENEALRAVRDAGTRLSLAMRAPADDDGCWEICVACDIGEELAALRAALDAVKES